MNNQMTLTVETRSSFGNTRIYPACAVSQAICSVANTKTLTANAVRQLAKAGFSFRRADRGCSWDVDHEVLIDSAPVYS